MFVPVVDKDQKPLMPTTPQRAARMIKSGKATPFWKKGIFCIRLNVEPSSRNVQEVVVGVDPGSKKEGFTVKSKAHTYLNIQTDAVTWVKDAMKTRSKMRKNRRNRNTPYRVMRKNRTQGVLAPSTKARWQWKLRILSWFSKMFPVSLVVVEDIKAQSKKGQKKWNVSFSPLESGKNWFYNQVRALCSLVTYQGYETARFRTEMGLKKIGDKLSNKFESHCVDSWVLAYRGVGGMPGVDNRNVILVTPIRLHRRQLHYLQPGKGGVRRRYGSTRSLGFTRGSLVIHPKWGLTYVGGNTKGRISLHNLETGEKTCGNARPEEVKFKSYSSWRTILNHEEIIK